MMIEDIAWFEELEDVPSMSFGGGTVSKIVKVLKVQIEGEWVVVPTVQLNPT